MDSRKLVVRFVTSQCFRDGGRAFSRHVYNTVRIIFGRR